MQQVDRLFHARQALVLVCLAALIFALQPVPAGAQPSAQAGVLRVGYLGPAGSDLANGAQLAMDQINGAGGLTAADGNVYQLELVTLAAQPTTDSLAADITAMLAQNVVALLGPDDNSPLSEETVQALVGAGVPVLTGATADTLTRDDEDNWLFRIRGPERVYSEALATYMIGDLGLTSIALVQTDVDSTEALLDFEGAMQSQGLEPGARIQLAGSSSLFQQSRELLDLNPEAIAMWGTYSDAANLLSLLRKGGWTGTFAYRHADEAARAGVLPDRLADGVLGVTAWSYAYTGRAARIFLQDYLLAFAEVPGSLAVAGYDAIWYLRAALIAGGPEPEALQAALIGGSPQSLVAGTLRPADFGDGDLIRTAHVYVLGAGGGPAVVARFDNGQRVAVEDAGS